MKIKWLEKSVNSEPVDDFLGLSPEQMHKVLYCPLDEMNDIIWFKSSFERSLIEDVPVVKKTTLLIKLLGKAGEAKATQNGYLPKKIVNTICEKPFDNYTVQSEEYELEVLSLRYTVTDCGWMKKKSGKFSLTKKGKLIFNKGFTNADYITLLKYWMKKFNWSFRDGHSPCPIVQQASVFLLYLLNRKAVELIPAEHITQLFIRAFPIALEEFGSEAMEFKVTQSQKSPEELLASILRLRFLERFAQYFGLIDYVIDETLSYFERNENAQVKTTKLFNEVFGFVSPEKAKLLKTADIKNPH